MAHSCRRVEFFYGDLSNHHFAFPSRCRILRGAPITLGGPLAAFSIWRGGSVDLCHFRPVRVIRSRKDATVASVTPGADRDQQPLPFARIIFHPDRVDGPGDFGRRNPDPGGHFPPGIPGSRHRVYGRNPFELERDATSQGNLG